MSKYEEPQRTQDLKSRPAMMRRNGVRIKLDDESDWKYNIRSNRLIDDHQRWSGKGIKWIQHHDDEWIGSQEKEQETDCHHICF